jgi:hypothetical protein
MNLPPSVWNKYSFSSFLSEFITSKILKNSTISNFLSLFLDSREYVHEVMYGLIVFSVSYEMLPLSKLLRHMRWKEHPSFSSYNESIPSRGC